MIKYPLLLFVLFMGMGAYSQSGSLPQLDAYLKKQIMWRSSTLNKDIPLKIYFLEDRTSEPDGAEVIVYLKNKAWERIGQEPDLSILRDYIQKKFIVITVDYGKEVQAVSPHFDKDLHDILKAVYGFKTESLLNGINLMPKDFRCFFLPEGYRVATNLVYWEIDKHGVNGTLEFIMETYNAGIVPKYPGLKTVSSPGEMVDRKGNPFDYKIKMDIIYPSQPRKKLPVIFLSETISTRNPNDQPSNYVPHFAGFATRGYVYVTMGHCFNPCVTHFFHFGPFTLDHENGYACYTAAMRFLHANAGKFGMNTDHIGGVGYSKGEYAITRLSDPHHESRKEEVRKFKGFPEGSPEPQPWQGYSSKIQAGMQGMGMGLFETEYITTDYVPNLIVCGENDREVITEAHQVFIKRCEELGVNHLGLFMQGLGHELPYGYDERMGIDRYQLVHDFFDRYLKVEEKLPPVVLVTSPFNNKEDVSPSSTISVQFAPVIDEKSILEKKGIIIINAGTKKEVKGSWKVLSGSTKFVFTPEQPLNKNERYKIDITTDVKDKAETRLDKEKIVQFKVEDKDTFKTIKIDRQIWMAENLNVNYFKNGDPIPEAKTNDEWIKAGKEARSAWCYYENKIENGGKYGKLYNWYAVNDPRGLAPENWHLPTDAEWRQVTLYLGGEDAAGTKMKSPAGWTNDGNGTNESGFSGYPGGSRNLFGKFGHIGHMGYWWCSTLYDQNFAWYRVIDENPYYVYRTNYYKQNGYSVRCIQD